MEYITNVMIAICENYESSTINFVSNIFPKVDFYSNKKYAFLSSAK